MIPQSPAPGSSSSALDAFATPAATGKLSARVAPMSSARPSQPGMGGIGGMGSIGGIGGGGSTRASAAPTPISASARAAWFDEDALAPRSPDPLDPRHNGDDLTDRLNQLAGPRAVLPMRQRKNPRGMNDDDDDDDDDGDDIGDASIGGADDEDRTHLRRERQERAHPLESLLRGGANSVPALGTNTTAFRKVGGGVSAAQPQPSGQESRQQQAPPLASSSSASASAARAGGGLLSAAALLDDRDAIGYSRPHSTAGGGALMATTPSDAGTPRRRAGGPAFSFDGLGGVAAEGSSAGVSRGRVAGMGDFVDAESSDAFYDHDANMPAAARFAMNEAEDAALPVCAGEAGW
jgi:hypothetical protein